MKNLKTPTPKEKQLQKENDLQRDTIASLEEESGAIGKALEEALYRNQRIDGYNQALAQVNDELRDEKAEIEQTCQITAESLLLERDELLVRVRRIDMRIKGLGFGVQ